VDNRRNYYRILHVQPDAPVEIIRSSYRTLMQRLKQHPDLGGDHWNAALINEAYRVLTSTQSREQYDHERQLIRRESSSSKPADYAADETTGPSVNQPADEPAAGTATTPDTDPACLFCLTLYDSSLIDAPDAVCSNCASPLFAASEWQLEHSDQRIIKRVEKHIDIDFYTTWPQPAPCIGQTLDVSPNGMRFISERRLGEGRNIKIASSAIEAVALVTHCQQNETNRWIVGVVFETLRFAHSQGVFFSARA
jgi:curved DNA-binding protein CbpA